MKSMVKDECAQPNALVDLSRTVVRGSFDGPSTSQLINCPFKPSVGEQLAQQYLENVADTTPASNTFDLTELKNQLSRIPDRPPVESSDVVKEAWSDEFLIASRPTSVSNTNSGQRNEEISASSTSRLASEWSRGFNRMLNSGSMETIWEHITSKPFSPITPATWSSDYLSQFDQSVKCAGSTANSWASEYLNEGMVDLGAESLAHANLESESDSCQGLMDTIERRASLYENYRFAEKNPYIDEEGCLEKAVYFMQLNHLPRAILYFEASLQKNSSDARAWYMLGLCQAENEDDAQAICALKRSIQLDSSTGDAYLSLAVSLTNESLEQDALNQLDSWIHAHPFYSKFLPSNEKRLSKETISTGKYFNEVEENFLRAAEMQPAEGDPDLQNAIGVLYNIKKDYRRASDALKAAVSMQSQDARLWNRLGATLSNSGLPAEAVGAYRQALFLFPNYVRAKYNLGIACMSMDSYREAIGHFVEALELQENTGALNSSVVWRTLRSAVLSLYPPNTSDLLGAAYARDLARFKNIL